MSPNTYSNKIHFRLIVVFIAFFSLENIDAQTIFNWKKDREYRETFVRVISQYGTILRRNASIFAEPDENGNEFKHALGLHLEYGWQTKGDADWESICNFPRFGVGLQQTIFLSRDDLGSPTSIYGFYNGNFIRTKRFQWLHQLGAGLAFGFKQFDPNVEPLNEIIGSKINAYIEAGTSFSFLINKRLSVEPGIRLTHFSNGNTRLPQKGINIVAYQLALRYQLTKEPTEFQQIEKPRCRFRHEIYGSIGFGTRQFDFTKEDNSRPPEMYDFNYLMSNITLGYLFEVRHQLKIGGGFDLLYDGTNGAGAVQNNGTIEKQDRSFGEKAGLLGFFGIEGVVDRLSISVNAGFVLVRKEFSPTPDFQRTTAKFQQRLSWKYHFLENVFLGMDITATEFHVAKSIQYKVGMRQFLKK